MNITIVIATALNRTELLLQRSLVSVYKQENVNPELINVIIVDDNNRNGKTNSEEFLKIKRGVEELRTQLSIPQKHFKTEVVSNNRKQGNSGTGAWNTGIFKAYSYYSNGFVSILDDDDEYLPNHISDCINNCNEHTAAVFQRLQWLNADNTNLEFPLTIELITPDNFFRGNPGVQGSNMFFKTQFLIDINGFDEEFPNTTDRDLLIRFLWHIHKVNSTLPSTFQVLVLNNIGVLHYNHVNQKVNNDFSKKQVGLDMFYKKYKAYFSEEDFQKSIIRAKAFFNYKES